MKKFLKENKGLSTLAFIALITIIVYILSVYYPHKFPNTDIWLELLFQLSIGYIINFIFYILLKTSCEFATDINPFVLSNENPSIIIDKSSKLDSSVSGVSIWEISSLGVSLLLQATIIAEQAIQRITLNMIITFFLIIIFSKVCLYILYIFNYSTSNLFFQIFQGLAIKNGTMASA